MATQTRNKGRRISLSQDRPNHEAGPESAPAAAIKRVLATQIELAMQQNRITKAEMARRMETSRSQLDRLLDPDGDSVTLETLARAAHAVGRNVRLELVERAS